MNQYESYMKSARGYVEIAEQANGPIPQPASRAYIWGDAIDELEQVAPDLRIINLETSITQAYSYWKNKGIHFRMNPANIACLTAAKIDYCSLANNHVLDWGYAGLRETLDTLRQANIKSAGAGRNLQEARLPAVIEIPGKGRVIVFSYGVQTSGIPLSWAAEKDMPGVNLLKELSDKTVQSIKKTVKAIRQARDIVVVSIHWGGNWGYRIPYEHITFAHQLIDDADVDVIHGHSSHHIKGIEVYHNKPILYGCGDFINDYEGISGYEQFRSDLGLMYFVSMEPSTRKLVRLHMTPTHIKHFKVNRVSYDDMLWLKNVLNRESKKFGTRIEIGKGNSLTVRWD
jgi:poly-gamma-glutamate synthesis protein (capsule biosynthesis protein)